MNNNLSKFNAALFDFDGTVMDTNGLIVESWQHTVKTLTGNDISLDEIRGSLGEVLSFSMERIMPDIDPALSVATYREYQHERYLSRINLFDGTFETLEALKNNGVKVALVTSRLANSTYKALDHFDVRKYFDAVLTAEDSTKAKPDPEPINLMVAKLGADPEKTVYVGDTVHDILAAKAAGVYTILADWSFALPKEKRLDAPQPDLVIEKMEDLRKLFGIL